MMSMVMVVTCNGNDGFNVDDSDGEMMVVMMMMEMVDNI